MDADASPDRAPAYLPDRVLVQLRPASTSRIRLQARGTGSGGPLGIASLDALGARLGAVRAVSLVERAENASVASALGLDRWVRVDLAPGSDVAAAVAAYAADPNVEAVEPDWILEPLVTPNDPHYPAHWGHNNTRQLRTFDPATGSHTGSFVGTLGFDANAEAGWTGPHGFGSAGTIIAILDSGVNGGHPDLELVAGYDVGDGDSDPEDDSATAGHGTACAGIAAAKANNGLGSCGSAPGCSIMPVKVSNTAGLLSTGAVADGLVWAADHGADVVSMSFGMFTHGVGSPAMNAAMEYANAAGVVMLAGTGNNNSIVLYPAIHPLVIGVGAASPCGGRKRSAASTAFLAPGVQRDPNNYTCDGQRWWGSNFGPAVQDAPDAVDILGPTILPTTDIQGPGGYAAGDYASFFNGASCSTPYVAGVAALIRSKHPDWTPAQVRQQLLTSAQDAVNVESVAGWDRYSGYGMVDIAAAVGCSAQPAIAGNEGVTVECGALVRAADLVAGVSDPDGEEDVVRVALTRVDDTEMDAESTVIQGAGVHSVRVTVTDYCGNTASALVDVTVIDSSPPTLAVATDRGALWPPNHRLVPVCAAVTASDACDARPDVALVSVVSSEPDEGSGDVAGADLGADDRCLELRSERTGGGNGRWYTIVYSATDAAGNVAYDTVKVHVPHDRSAEALASSGFTADGTGLDPEAATFALIVTGSEALDVRRIDPASLEVGNTAGVVRASGTRVVDVNADRLADLAVFFAVSDAEEATARRGPGPAHGPVGLHFTLEDGTGHLVRDIHALGAPVAMPSAAASGADAPERTEVVARTQPSAADPTAPRILALTSIRPNPFHPRTTVHFSLPGSERVRISIYDVTGALVRQLVDERLPAGDHQASWDGASDRGAAVTTGVYFVRMTAGSFRDVRKIVIAK